MVVEFSELFDEGKNKKKKATSKNKEKKIEEKKTSIDFSSLIDKAKPEDKSRQKKPISINFPSLSKPSSRKEKPPSPSIDFSSFLEKNEITKKPPVDMVDIYRKAIDLAEKIFHSDLPSLKKEIKEVNSFINSLVDYIQVDHNQLLECVFGDCLPRKVDFLVLNLVNVCILSLELGLGLGYNRNQLVKLGIAAFLHDIGMRRFQDLTKQTKKFTLQEKRKLEKHPSEGAELLKKLQEDLEPSIKEIIEQEHERRDGSGYPKGLKEDEINEYAQIIGLVDVYEALTHSRPHREAYSYLEAFKIIIGMKKTFSYKILDTFLKKIGIYPQGTYVELNTREIAQVVKQNPKLPSYPLVRVIYDNKGEKLKTPKEIDLSRNPAIHIKRCL